jgi:hypothetical protein
MVNPFFATDGTLAVTLNNIPWSFSELEGWQTNAAARPVEESKTVPAQSPPPFPPPASARVDSAVTDRLGTHWMIAGGQLFRSAFGLTRTCFAANEPEPFADGRKLAEVLRDNFGGVFLRTSVQGRDEYVFMPGRGPLPRAAAKLVENDEDGVALELAADIPSPRFSWRLDDTPWKPAATNQALRFDELSAGRHRFQVIALDEQLQASQEVTEVAFETHFVPLEQVQKWIAQLGDRDFALREAAVRSLSRHPDAALPVLRRSRQSESDPDRRWWLDAAIQQCNH